MPVYFLGEAENGCSPIKIGVTKDIARRKRTLQTGNPLELRLLGWIVADDSFQLERQLHEHFESVRTRGEWFHIEPADVLLLLTRVGRQGFVAKNADAFQIIGYDRDAIPEYLGVWEWADLEIDECCPICGCLCGMHFQEACKCTTASSATRSPTSRNRHRMTATGRMIDWQTSRETGEDNEYGMVDGESARIWGSA
ncbi:MAG: GIY-YIG nuclease family protein [Steroidobacteraceae bacterium]